MRGLPFPAGAPRTQSPALTLDGQPAGTPIAGREYKLTLRLLDEALRRSAFVIVARAERGEAGSFKAIDLRVEGNGDRARSTLLGTELVKPGFIEWSFVWRAPAAITGPIFFDVSANAADDDRSPLGDAIHLERFRAEHRA